MTTLDRGRRLSVARLQSYFGVLLMIYGLLTLSVHRLHASLTWDTASSRFLPWTLPSSTATLTANNPSLSSSFSASRVDESFFDTKVLAIYFPQYHPDPLNDKFWGLNFTDWRSLQHAPEKNRMHYRIPRPQDLGDDSSNGTATNDIIRPSSILDYYDLRETKVRCRQGQLAKAYGIDGFVMHHYWFYDATADQDSLGGPTLAAPLLRMLQDGEPNIPFYFNWCAASWSNVWMGKTIHQSIPTSQNRAIVLQRQYFNATSDMITHHYEWLRPFFHHHNYLKIDNQPIFMLYQLFKEAVPILRQLRRLAIEDGFDGLYLLLGRSGSHVDLFDTSRLNETQQKVFRRRSQSYERFAQYMYDRDPLIHQNSSLAIFNKSIAYPYPSPWVDRAWEVPQWCSSSRGTGTAPSILTKDTWEHFEIPGVITSFDNTPRRDFQYSTLWNIDEPDKVVQRFNDSLYAAVYFSTCCLSMPSGRPSDDHGNARFVLVNAWNEWAEGMSLEPSDVYGRRFLQVVRDVKRRIRQQGCPTL